jgi:hypothetical protein
MTEVYLELVSPFKYGYASGPLRSLIPVIGQLSFKNVERLVPVKAAVELIQT